jgi:hypothetical protein
MAESKLASEVCQVLARFINNGPRAWAPLPLRIVKWNEDTAEERPFGLPE